MDANTQLIQVDADLPPVRSACGCSSCNGRFWLCTDCLPAITRQWLSMGVHPAKLVKLGWL